MKILFLADIVPYPPNTGIKIRTFNVIKELSDSGNEVYLLAFNHRVFIDTPERKAHCRRELEKLCKEVHIFEIPSDSSPMAKYALYMTNMFSVEPYRVQRYYSKECIAVIAKILAETRIDLCHLDKTEFFKYKPFLGALPVFATNHNVESDLMRQRVGKERGWARKLFALAQWIKTRRYEREALSRVNGYVVCSDIDAGFFKERLGITKPVQVVPNGVDCSYYVPGPARAQSRYFLIIGAQNKESTANYDATMYFLREIWPLVKKSDAAVVVKIVGRNVDSGIAKYAEGDGRIEVVGYVEDEREVFRDSLALIVPLRIGGGSRLKILTAFGLGKAVISTGKGAEGICYTDGADILIGDSAQAFADHMLELWSDPGKAERLGQSARNLAVRQYDWKILVARLLRFYRDNL